MTKSPKRRDDLVKGGEFYEWRLAPAYELDRSTGDHIAGRRGAYRRVETCGLHVSYPPIAPIAVRIGRAVS